MEARAAMDETQLRIWAESHSPAGSPQAAIVLALLDEVTAYRANRVDAGHGLAG